MERGAASGGEWSYALLSRCRGELMGLALLWIMLFHTYHLAVIPLFPLEWFKSVGYAGVDVFLFLSALGLALSLSRRKQRLGEYLTRRFVRILPTYWLVVGSYGLILRLAGRINLRTVLWNLSTLYYWFHIPNTFNWYVPALLAFYFLTPFLFRVLDRWRYRELLPALLWCFVLPFSTWLGFRGLVYVNDFVYRLPIFTLGLLLGWYIAHDRPLSGRDGAVWGALVLLSPLPGRFFPKVGVYFPPTLTFTLLCVPLCLVTARLLSGMREDALVRRGLRVLGESSLEIYLFNVIFVLEYDVFSAFLDLGPGRLFYYAFTTALNIGLGMLLHRLLAPLTAVLQRHLSAR